MFAIHVYIKIKTHCKKSDALVNLSHIGNVGNALNLFRNEICLTELKV
jgi:hypothetical protein